MSRTSESGTERRLIAGVDFDFPAPSAGHIGWPWAADAPARPRTDPADRHWPRISVVTPSYNQAGFLEATLRSVLLQGYPDLELIVIDGGSTDGSVDILRQYFPWLTYCCSEPDRGQSHAINKGFARATGEILAWLNSDDLYYPGAIWRAAEAMTESGSDIVIGAMDKVAMSSDGPRLVQRSHASHGQPMHDFPIIAGRQPASFHLSLIHI